MSTLHVGLVADPAEPAEVARRFRDAEAGAQHQGWDVELVEEPFTVASEDIDTALSRLTDHARDHDWDLVVGVTELPLRDDQGNYLVVETDSGHRAAVLSLPAVAGVRGRRRSRRALGELVARMADDSTTNRGGSVRRRSSRWRLLLGMVFANRPWRLIPSLKSALVAALATGAIATINSGVWLLSDSLPWWRLAVATVASIALVVGWLIVDGHLWDRPDNDSPEARERSRLYNISTVLTLTAGAAVCYLALYVLNLVWALFILDPAVMGGFLQRSISNGDLFALSWFVASAATVGGALGSGLESDEAIRAATYSKREEERRRRLAGEDDDRDGGSSQR